MTAKAQYALNLTVTETLTGAPASKVPSIIHDKFDSAGTLNASSVPPVTDCAIFQKALAAGVGTIDLTAAPTTMGSVFNATGKRVQAYKFRNSSTHAITIQSGAANPYDIFGAGGKHILQPGDELLWKCSTAPGTLGAVGAGAKNIDLAGTGTDLLDVELLFG